MNKPRLFEYERPAYITGLPHRVLQPQAPPPYKTVVMLHGRHGNEDVTWVFAPSLPKDWLVIAPRAIEFEPELPDGEGYSWLLQGDWPALSGNWPALSAFKNGAIAVEYFIKALPEVYQADPNHIYLLGFSQGAATALATAMNNPGLVQGVCSLVGFVPDDAEPAIQNLRDMPIFMAAGRTDDRIPLGKAQEGAHRLQAAGANLSYHEYDMGHKMGSSALRDLKQWWLERSEKP